jgi:4-amino-4-deoxy-L-arabinose transferase-like glycosyltransferase
MMNTRESFRFGKINAVWLFWGFALLILVYRFAVSLAIDFNLGFDESYYWYWSQSPAFGYYSKPPFMAWMIALTSSVCGDQEICVRLGSLLAYPVTAFIIFLLGRRLFNERTGLIAGLLFLTMPGVALGNILITTDAFLLLFWAISLLLLFTAVDTNRYLHWILFGICAGLGLMSKYTMVLFAPSALLFFILFRKQWSQFRNPRMYLSAFIALLVFLPNILWNIDNDFPTVRHTVQISHLDHAGLQFKQLSHFLVTQFAVFGPIAFAIFIWCSIYLLKKWHNTSLHQLLPFALVFLCVISLQAILARANANWAAPTYVAGSLMVAAFLIQSKSRVLLILLFASNILLSVLTYHYDQVLEMTGTPLTSKNDAFRAVRGWKQLGQRVQPLLAEHPDALLLADSRHELAELIYYINPHPMDAVKWNPTNEVQDHFDIVTHMQDKLGRSFIYVTTGSGPASGIQESFTQVTKLENIVITIQGDYGKSYTVYLLEDFQGYPARK